MAMLTPIATAEVGVFDHEPILEDFNPEFVAANDNIQFYVTVGNAGPDAISEFRMYNVSQYTDFSDFEALNTTGWDKNWNNDDSLLLMTQLDILSM